MSISEDLLKIVKYYYYKNEWKNILQLPEIYSVHELRKLMWIWPKKNRLNYFLKILGTFQLDGYISIGCGCGLFEWILEKSLSIKVIGYEINKEWWYSKYSCPQFIKLQFPQMPPKSEQLNSNYALIFCYFNNSETFLEYVSAYNGNVILIIGPGKGTNRYTDPEPFNPKFRDNRWQMIDFMEINDDNDFAVVYSRKKLPF